MKRKPARLDQSSNSSQALFATDDFERCPRSQSEGANTDDIGEKEIPKLLVIRKIQKDGSLVLFGKSRVACGHSLGDGYGTISAVSSFLAAKSFN